MTRGPERDVKRKDVYEQFTPGIPETAATLAENFDCHPDTVMNRAKELSEMNKIHTKKPGSRARVYWIPAPDQTVDRNLITDEMFRSGKDPGILRVMADYMNDGSEPVTSGKIADHVDDSQDIIYNRLRKLDDRGWVESLKAGATSKVWWLNKDKLETEADTGPNSDVNSTAEMNADSNVAPEDDVDSSSGSEPEDDIALRELRDHFDELVERADPEIVEDGQSLLNIIENPPDREQSQTSLTVSEALKDHLREIAGKAEVEGVEGVQTVQEALIHILDNPHDEKKSLTGYEKTLTEPIKVSRETLNKLSGLRDWTGARDLEEAIRRRANIERRDVGERPVDVSDV